MRICESRFAIASSASARVERYSVACFSSCPDGYCHSVMALVYGQDSTNEFIELSSKLFPNAYEDQLDDPG